MALAITIGSRPLSMSPSKVKAAGIFPPSLKTLVVPGFSEPFVLGSGKLKSFEAMIAVEIEPNKYAAMTTKMGNIIFILTYYQSVHSYER